MVILIQSTDQVGLVAAISSVLAKQGWNIISLREYVDPSTTRFFIRIETSGQVNDAEALLLQRELSGILPATATVQVNPIALKKIVVMVTKEHHCLSDLLVRHHFKELGASIQCVIGNHPDLEDLCQRFDVPFYAVAAEGKDKAGFEAGITSIIDQYQPDFIVLAKFMRILSAAFNAKYPLKIINIHHSFLPAFIGANPYKQAFERGVKLIGATAHFVTDDLDEGPIIFQEIIPVNHTYNAQKMRQAGKEIEMAVLARALQLVFDDRVFVFRNKTVVFD
ncbi:formyltetrahydrofolate deformylase [Chitinophaga caeni]|uniref:Formyltetrahydrofolate deformylase n=1 Tax=Chitinophaga caeni TaxID=2029983 RepID=A0A291QVM0_9BACT|nr:formyltetrahydrofolate deformylase [Chitinophaga caeni]ATL48008.1 formyltetrahydrofolate deformylase [Chitinophaga caeni]